MINITVVQTTRFRQIVKKLHVNQKRDLHKVVRLLVSNPIIGDAKIGDLSGVRVYKFKMTNQLTLLAYSYDEQSMTITLLALHSHQNFYRDLKRQIQ